MIRLAEAAAQIGKDSNGRMELVVFPNGQLGGDNDLLSQARQGAIEFCQPTGHIFSLILPVTAKTIVARNLNAAALLEREDIARKDKMVQGDLETVGLRSTPLRRRASATD